MGFERYIISAGIALVTSVAAGGELPAHTAKPAGTVSPGGLHRETPRDSGTWSRDPFRHQKDAGGRITLPVRPLPVGPRHEITVQGIMNVDGTYYALVNGRVVKAGERVDRTLVENISRYRVVTKDDTGRRTIDIYAGETPKR